LDATRKETPLAGRSGHWGVLLTLLVVYVLSGNLGLGVAFVHAKASAVWPPTGIALASFLVFGRRVWPAIWLGAFLVNISTPGLVATSTGSDALWHTFLLNLGSAGSVATSIGIATGNTLEGLLGAFLVNRYARGCNSFDHPRTVFTFTLLAIVSTAVSATIGVSSLALGAAAKWEDFGAIWLTWWLGDAVGAVLVAPLCVLWSADSGRRWSGRQVFEAVLLLLTVGLVGQLQFGGWLPNVLKNHQLTFLCIPPVLWAAFRFGQRETVTVNCVLSVIAIWGTLRGYGPFVGRTQNESLILLQAFTGVIAVMGMAVNAVVTEYQRAEDGLQQAHDKLEQRVNERTVELAEANRALRASRELLMAAQQVARMGSWEWDIHRNVVNWSAELYRVFGLDAADAPLTYERFLECVHPGDRPFVRETVERALRERQSFSFDHRIVRPDGVERVVHGRGEVIVNEAGGAVRMIGTAEDITERKLAEAVLRDAHDELERRVRERTAELAAANDAFLAEIAEHKRTAEALRDSQTRLQAIFENSIDAIVVSKSGLHVLANPAYLKMFGYCHAGEITGRSVLEVISPDQRERVHGWIRRRAIGADAPTHYETRGLRKDGSEFVLEVDVSTYKLKGEIYTLAILRDVTERKRAEVLLRESEALKGAILESALDCIITIDHEGKVIEWNPAAEATFGYKRSDVLGREMSGLIIPPALREKHRQGFDRFMATGSGPVIGRRVEMTAMRAGGCEFPVELAITRIARDGPPAFTAYVREITERKHAEEMRKQLAAIVESSDDAIISETLDGAIASWNAGAERIFGYTAEEVLGRPITLLVPCEHHDEELQILEKVRQGFGIAHYETVRRRKDGSKIHVSLTLSPVRDSSGRLIGASKIARDITERKRAEEEIRKLNTELEQRVIERTGQLEAINRELESFTYSVSHDLRAPLRAMQGLANALLEDYHERLDEVGKDYAARIVSAAARMETLIQDLLAYSRLSRVDLELRPVDLDLAFAEVKHQLESEIRDRKALVLLEGAPPKVIGHRATLVQVISNLVSNGTKFVGSGVTPRVVMRTEDQGEYVKLWVEDNGIGIAPEYHERIFRIFERLHGVESYPGTGVGLAIVQKGAERLGGRVGVESKPGCGSRFWVELKKA
jgi:PAS domain S-box-containing protein